LLDEVIAREVLEEFAAVPGAVVRVGAEAEVEEGEVRDAVKIISLAWPSSIPFSLQQQEDTHTGTAANGNVTGIPTKHHPNLLLCSACLSTPNLSSTPPTFQLSLRRRRQRLQPPFLKRNPPEQRISVVGHFFLPAFFGFFPGRPDGAGFGDDAVGEGRFGCAGGEGRRDAFAVDEGAAGGDGEEEEAHCVWLVVFWGLGFFLLCACGCCYCGVVLSAR
jgi:hypothetical protein